MAVQDQQQDLMSLFNLFSRLNQGGQLAGLQSGSGFKGLGSGGFSSAGSAGPVGLMILATLLAQAGGESRFEPGSTGAKFQDALLPSVTANLDNPENLIGQALGLNPITAFLFPRKSKGKTEGTQVLNLFGANPFK